ncbi:DUF2271 domain-containing protein [Sphingomonas oryzagri]|uniref:DUF2271 domain-containing protein n=1 Tax=Sphingomonas oryzagri TaxID=3042314 RepID=A0ABT6MXV3_9SPHN|nr:DUF2271 domain-containing protein [Sphingomonas oryzagri]MDH7637846.1 DUF2271 domain-containing protein [Sphingomonas oryzagri]
MSPTRLALVAGTIIVPASVASAASITVTVPRIDLAEYKKPYVAGWIEPAGGGQARSLFVWYQLRNGGKEPGTKWLSELRSWWRKSGRMMQLPADGVSGATRGPGSYSVALPANLPAGNYVVHVEAAREHGTRELVSVPVTLPAANGRASGKAELGAVVVAAK